MFGSGLRRAGLVISIALAALAVACTPTKPAPTGSVIYESAGTYEFTVPAGVTQILVSAAGGAGGSFPSPTGQQSPVPGGRGGQAVAAIAVTPGEVLTIGVGGRGFDGSQPAPGLKCLQAQGGANGGGDGGEGFNSCGGGGGGWSGLARGSQPLLVAAGGGGGSYDGYGGGGGGTEGLPGGDGTVGVGYGKGGGGGTQSDGGSGGAGAAAGAGANGTAGTGGQGGNHATAGGISGGGGGGGFRGGGGGGAGFGYFAGGGGGGSGFGPPGTVFETGVRAGSGVVIIAW